MNLEVLQSKPRNRELSEVLLSVAVFKRRAFFKIWNELKQLDGVSLEAENLISFIVEKLGVLPKVRLSDCEFYSFFDSRYPAILKELPQPPVGIFVRGSLPLSPGVAIVGSRKPHMYSRRMSRRAAQIWTQKGYAIVSGGAIGVDGDAHEACLQAGGKTIVVMGGGFHHLHPKSHERLFENILRTGGCWLSEYPPDFKPQPYTFPERNRIIAALGEALFLAQAHEKSGSLLTARTALDLGREIFVLRPIPGDAEFTGGQLLIEAGAHCLVDPEDLLKY